MLIFETRRLIFRELVPDDAQSLFDIYQGEDVMKYMPHSPESVEKEKEKLIKMQETYLSWGFGLWATVLKETNSVIGRCGLLQWELEGKKEVEVAYLIGREHWRQGFGTEAAQGIVKYAVQTLGLRRLISLIHRRNRASIQVASNLTMNFESTMRFQGKLFSMYALDLEYSGIPEYFNYS